MWLEFEQSLFLTLIRKKPQGVYINIFIINVKGKYIFKPTLIAHIKTGDISDGYISEGLRVVINIPSCIYLSKPFHQESRMGSYENRNSWEATNTFQSLGESSLMEIKFISMLFIWVSLFIMHIQAWNGIIPICTIISLLTLLNSMLTVIWQGTTFINSCLRIKYTGKE